MTYTNSPLLVCTRLSPNHSGQRTHSIEISDLNIRTDPGTDYFRTDKYNGIGVFTIVEVKSGKGSTAGWGRLKSGAGWISLDYATKL